MDYRKDNWLHELECFRKAVNGNIDGYKIDISEHYTVDRFENDQYSDRTFTNADIAVAIFRGTIVEGFSSEQNRQRASRALGLIAPSRVVLGQDLSGKWVVVVIGIIASLSFKVVTCYPATNSKYLEMIRELEKEK